MHAIHDSQADKWTNQHASRYAHSASVDSTVWQMKLQELQQPHRSGVGGSY